MFRWIRGKFTREEASSFFVSCVLVDRGNLYWGIIASSFFVSCVKVDRGTFTGEE